MYQNERGSYTNPNKHQNEADLIDSDTMAQMEDNIFQNVMKIMKKKEEKTSISMYQMNEKL
jgi:hypothetical protein